MFTHVRAVIGAARARIDDIVKMTFWVADYRDRDAFNREWLTMFPDVRSRPARQVMGAVLDRGALVHCNLVAVINGSDGEL